MSSTIVARNARSTAFRVEELAVNISVSNNMLVDMGFALVDSERTELHHFGFNIGAAAKNPFPNPILSPSLVVSVSSETANLFIGKRLMVPLGVAFKASDNKAVARLGYELLRMNDELEKL